MKKSLFIFIAMTFSFIQFQAQEEHHYFPTGMKWKEVMFKIKLTENTFPKNC